MSYRQVFRSTAIMGGATFLALLVSIARTKSFALSVGMEGVGLFGIYSAVLATAASLVGLGLSTGAVRQIASAKDEQQAAHARRSAWTLTWTVAILGSLVVVALRKPLAELTFGNHAQAADLGWLSLALALTIVSVTQIAVMQAYRRIGDLARLRLYATTLGVTAGTAAVLALGMRGVIVAIVTIPLSFVALGFFYYKKLDFKSQPKRPIREMLAEWRILVVLGTAVTAGALISNFAQIYVRSLIVQDLGLDAAGLFAAAYTISGINVGLVLSAMATDFLPRISAVSEDAEEVGSVMNQQIRVAFLLAGPSLLLMALAAPLIIRVLYSSEFTGAATMLQWHAAADALRIGGWGLGFVFLGRKAVIAYITVEFSLAACYVLALPVLVSLYGLEGAGISYFAGYAVCFVVAILFAGYGHGIWISRLNMRFLLTILALVIGVGALYRIHLPSAIVVGSLVLGALLLRSIHEAVRMNLLPPSVVAMLNSIGLVRLAPS